jgi:5-methylcytosine-specific restriction enzyme A
MPTKALRKCHGSPVCPYVQGHCPNHVEKAWHRQQPAPPRIRGRQLQRLRERLFRNQPLCAQCSAMGRDTIATIRDHIIPLAEGGQDVEANTQGLCQDCSDAKTHQESLRGRARTWFDSER